ncbi:putative spermidine/putrescine transport system ATP-binding protein [Bosea sp. AK1]|uniref:ABC transporter ATP-binding protein n=1 Tax=Bosea sp. AK1 TaxID=2587160 RepID=UPI001150976E|nr:ABC transporter ATP-binding protein [Bosea sp. AK1]TQI65315.1 putative spermidine/putrescine transport system ATP-binding protein [Bosea sp. AK1]
MSSLSLRNVCKQYADFTAVHDFSLDIEQGELIVFLGPSGCGKTTTLRMVAGFIEPTTGSIILGDKEITRVPVYDRNIGVVFQNYALFPHLSVFENVAFGLRRRKVRDGELRKRVADALGIVQMEHLAERKPSALSGGQQQRVAIARAIAIDPAVLLLDEPLSNLDAKLRLDVRRQVRDLQKSLGITAIFVTHDQEEAMSVADRIVVMDGGNILQIGTPQEVYSKPVSRFVANFIGSANCLGGRCDGADRFLIDGRIPVASTELFSGCDSIMIRSEAISLWPDDSSPDGTVLDVELRATTYLGSGALLHVSVGGIDLDVRTAALPATDWLATIANSGRLRIKIPASAVVGIV